MAAIASVEDLASAKAEMTKVKFTKAQKEVLKKHASKGWKNLMRMLVYDWTPEETKQGKRK